MKKLIVMFLMSSPSAFAAVTVQSIAPTSSLSMCAGENALIDAYVTSVTNVSKLEGKLAALNPQSAEYRQWSALLPSLKQQRDDLAANLKKESAVEMATALLSIDKPYHINNTLLEDAVLGNITISPSTSQKGITDVTGPASAKLTFYGFRVCKALSENHNDLTASVNSLVADIFSDLPKYPSGFSKTQITFDANIMSKVQTQRNWYCATIQVLEQSRLSTLPDEIKTKLQRTLKFSNLLCDPTKGFVGLAGPKDPNEKAYVDFRSLEDSIFYLQSAFYLDSGINALASADEVYQDLQMTQQGITDLSQWMAAQTGYDPSSYPKIVDPVKYQWTSNINSWVQNMYLYYAK